jgi:hypothetical protein
MMRMKRAIAVMTMLALAGCAAPAERTDVPGAPATVLRGRLIDGTGAALVREGRGHRRVPLDDVVRFAAEEGDDARAPWAAARST